MLIIVVIWRAQKLAGMTGTAITEAAEFSNIYKLEVTEVPTNRPINRIDNPDVVFRSEAGGAPFFFVVRVSYHNSTSI